MVMDPVPDELALLPSATGELVCVAANFGPHAPLRGPSPRFPAYRMPHATAATGGPRGSAARPDRRGRRPPESRPGWDLRAHGPHGRRQDGADPGSHLSQLLPKAGLHLASGLDAEIDSRPRHQHKALPRGGVLTLAELQPHRHPGTPAPGFITARTSTRFRGLAQAQHAAPTASGLSYSPEEACDFLL